MNGWVLALTVYNFELIAGGEFTTAGGQVSAYWARWGCLYGDLNCDGAVNTSDIDAFVLALTNPSGYQSAYPNCYLTLADCNRDGQINAFDIDPFVRLIVP